jgi:hypothetical protein
MQPPEPRTLFDKIWDAHVVQAETADAPAILYVDLHLIHEVTSPQAFAELDQRGVKVRRPDRTYGTLDHSTPTLPPNANGQRPYASAAAATQGARHRGCRPEYQRSPESVSREDQALEHAQYPPAQSDLQRASQKLGSALWCGDPDGRSQNMG